MGARGDSPFPSNSDENRGIWSSYDWPDGGDEWSNPWGGTHSLWHGFILPRIHKFLPPVSRRAEFCALEIAPGHGRCTQFLKDLAPKLLLVDLVEECIAFCRKRFAGCTHLEYHTNDGSTLPMLGDGSIDFAFSWGSLVHVDRGPLRSHVFELARVLRSGGVAFLHHSNLGAHAHELGEIDPNAELGNRRVSVSASLVAEDCRDAGLRCLCQELMTWNDRRFYGDCISPLTQDAGRAHEPHAILFRSDFGEELAPIRRASEHYRRSDNPGSVYGA